MMELYENGLRKEMMNRYRAGDTPCLKKTSNGPENESKFQLSIKNLVSAFFVLIVGYVISLMAFVGESYVGRRQK